MELLFGLSSPHASVKQIRTEQALGPAGVHCEVVTGD